MVEARILVVEDEAPVRELLSLTLEGDGYQVTEVRDAEAAERVLDDELPALILLDWMLPGLSGLEFTRRLKKDDLLREIPIIMLTARGEEEYKVSGLEAGVDDYVTKPFSTRELLARIKAVMRRAGGGEGDVLDVGGDLKMDLARHSVTVGVKSLKMGPTEFRLLHFFITHPERVYSRDQLLDRVWGRNAYIEERTVDVHIRRLRKALEPSGHDKVIQTVRGVGYRFSTQPAI
ncbi:MAG: phosphate regulon transcriptional regulator PhoB [Pseudomonadota bacterium]